ncbi:MAG: cadmium-translocating P-type ATPase [Candidatus Brocadiaceae bacterium]|nr:cadmium-translocating P-type ATPase [Candidatus Brocadiaceae bacterium]
MAEAALQSAHEHEHVGTIQTRLVITFIGGALVINAYLANLLFPNDPIISGVSGLVGALILAGPILLGGMHEMRRGRMHMSVLVAIAVLASFALGNYSEAGIIAFFMMLASLIEQQTAAGARESVEKLMTLTPPTAELISGETVRVSDLKKGDRIRVRPGDRIAADGRIVSGETTINEATITGESFPVDKGTDAEVFAGTTNVTGSIEVEVTRVGEDTTLGKVKRLILDAESTKTPMMQLIDRYAHWYTPVVLMVAFMLYVFTKDMRRVITVLVVCCPCAFVLATPTAMVAGLSAAARLGVLIKKVAHLEAAGDISAVVFDKTGTLTTGELTVTRLSPAPDVDGVELLTAAASVEHHSRHPVAQAIQKIAARANIIVKDVHDFRETPGRGVEGRLGDSVVIIGRASFLEERGVKVQEVQGVDVSGMSMLFVARDGECIGWMGLEDRARPEAKQATESLRDLGVQRISMLTGDRWSVAKRVAGELGCTDVQGECLPEQKLRLVEILRSEGHMVAVVGDGVNDAPALAAGDLGIAMGAAGSDVAIDSASIALMSDDLGRLPFLVRLSRRLRTVIVQNILVGVVFVVGGATLGVMAYISPILAAVLHNISSFIVIFNSARLVRFGENLSPYSGTALKESEAVPVSA